MTDKKKIEMLEKQLDVAKKALRTYANLDLWCFEGMFEGGSAKYTSFHLRPLSDGWIEAQEAMNTIRIIQQEGG